MNHLRRFWPQLTVTLYALLSIQPLARRQMTCSDDAFYHINKAVSLEQAIQAGHWFGRWMPNMAHGYGYPHFNYYAPLPSYLMIGLHKLGFIYPTALHILLALCLLTAGLATLALVRQWWGPSAGVLAAVVYITAPYFAFDILFRGALAEVVALPLIPATLLALDRALTNRHWRWGTVAAISFAALIYAHNSTALIAAPMIAAYGLLLAAEKGQWRDLQAGLAIGIAGLGLSARFWLPALLERDLVQSDRLLVPPIFTYYTNYITPGELLAPPQVIDPLLLNPSPAKGLGLVAVLLALLGLLAWQRHTTPGRRRLALFAGLLLGYALMMLPFSRPLWDTIPLLQFVQFPWRLAGPGMLCAALLAGAATHWLKGREWLVASLLAAIAVIGHLSWWYPRYCSEFHEVDLADMLRYEYATFTIGTTAKGEFLPVTVKQFPSDDTLAEALMAGEPPQWLAGLPADAIEVTRNDPLDFHATLSIAAPVRVQYHQFYFPGWRAHLDSEPLPIVIPDETGVMAFDLPPGEHELQVKFGPTPLRALAEGITVLTTMSLFLATLMMPAETIPLQPQPTFTRGHWLAIALPLILLALRVGYIDRTTNLLRHTALVTDGITFPGGLIVTGSHAPAQVAAGDSFDALLTLTTAQPITGDYRPKFTLEGNSGLLWNTPNDALPPRWHREPPPTWEWPPNHYAQWARHETVLPGTPPGNYPLWATIFDLETLLPVGERILVETITVTRPDTPAEIDSLPVEYPANLAITPQVELLGFNLDRREARPGDPMLVTFFWRASDTPPGDVQVTLGLEGSPHTWTLEPTPGYPTGQWQAGDVWRGQHLFRLPADLESGAYLWTLDGQPLESLQVEAPAHTFEPPAGMLAEPVAFGDAITLAAAQTPAEVVPGQPLDVILFWQTSHTPEIELRSFVHLVNAGGEIVAQHDGPPANGERPAPGWLPGEYIADAHSLAIPADLPPGEYTLLAGLVDVAGGAAIPAAGSADGRAWLVVVVVR